MLLPLLALSLLSGGSTSDDKTPTTKALYERCRPSVVSVETSTGRGTGFFYGDGKTIVTCLHVVLEAKTITVRDHRGKTWQPKRIAIDVAGDIAVLYLGSDSGHVGLPHAPSQEVEIGDEVVVIGDPQGLRATLSTGIVSGLRSFEGVPEVQMTAPISHGSSGGPVLDRKGRVLGVVASFLREGQNLNLAISTQVVKWVLARNETMGVVAFAEAMADAKRTVAESDRPVEGRSVEGRPEPAPKESGDAKVRAKTRLAADLIGAYADLFVAQDRWLVAWSEIFEKTPETLARLNSCRKELKARAASAERTLRDGSTLREAGASATTERLLLKALADLQSVSEDVYESELAALDADAESNGSSPSEKAVAANKAVLSLQTRRKLLITDLARQIYSPELGLSQEECYDAMPVTVLTALLLDDYLAILDHDRPAVPVIRSTWEGSKFKDGDVVTGVRIQGSSVFRDVKSWTDVWDFSVEKSGDEEDAVLVFRVRRGNSTALVELPEKES